MEIVRKTISQIVDEAARKDPKHEALVHTELGVRYPYGLLAWEVNRISRGLLSLGLRMGDKAALWADNVPEWIIAQLSIAKMGGVVVPIDPAVSEEELRYMVEQSGSRILIMARGVGLDESVDLALSLKTDLPFLENILVIGDPSYPETIPWGELGAMGEEVNEKELKETSAKIRPDDPVAIMYTSGTTGKPKGVVLNHLGLVNKSLCATERQGVTKSDRLALFFPLFHMFGNTCIALAGLFRGSTLIMPCREFDPSKVLHAISKELCTAVYGSPSMLIALLDHPEFNQKKWKALSKGTIGGASCPVGLMRRLVQEAGVSQVTVGYGVTEASSWITMTLPDDPLELRATTIGTPLPCNEVKITNPRSGEEVPVGTQGELCTRGFLMTEYYKMPAATKAAVDEEGWFHCGDLGEQDENGYVRITGRIKDVIVREGTEIHPSEVEEVLYGIPEISEAQVFGFAHPARGQEVAAWVKFKEGAALDMTRLQDMVKRRLGPEKAPSYFKIVKEFPMTRSGKVQKYKLAELAEREYGSDPHEKP